MEVGFEWVYRGQVRWTEVGSRVLEKELEWRVRVLEVLRRKRQVVARLEGWLEDLAWYEPGKHPGTYLLISDPQRGLHLLGDPAAQALWTRLRTSAAASVSAQDLEEADHLLPPELSEGMTWGDPESLARRDGLYVRRVESVGTQGLEGLGGWTGPHRAPFFRIAYRTHPDHTLVEFVPGLGFTSFTYVHHGTVAECDMRLVAVERTRKVRPGKGN